MNRGFGMSEIDMWEKIGAVLNKIDDLVWGVPLIVLIMVCGLLLTVRLRGIQFTKLGKALKFMVQNEENGHGEVTSFGALCTSLSATIGTGYSRRCNCYRRSFGRTGRAVLDVGRCTSRYGYKIFRGISCNKVSYH